MSTMTIDSDFFEHLLNCLDNQKFLPQPKNQSKREKEDQKAIDDANRQGRELLRMPEARAGRGNACATRVSNGQDFDACGEVGVCRDAEGHWICSFHAYQEMKEMTRQLAEIRKVLK